MNNLLYFLFILAGYLSGSVLFGYFIPKYCCHVDVTQLSTDGNPGTANVFAYAGIPAGITVLILDLAKGFLPVFFAARLLDSRHIWFAVVMCAPVAGHAFPFWRRNGGGKAIAVSFGVLLGLLPQYLPVAILVFFYLVFSLVIRINPHFYRSVLTYFCFSCLSFLLMENRIIFMGCFLISFIVIFKHAIHYQGEKLEIRLGFLHKEERREEAENVAAMQGADECLPEKEH